MKVRVLLNPASGRGRGARLRARLASLAGRAGLALEESTSAEDLVVRAAEAAEAGVERLLVAGGDGTWHHAARGLAGTETALAPLPAGTGNDLARELGYSLRLEDAFAAALAGRVERIDLGRIDFGRDGVRRFCGVAGFGFDAAVAEYARTRVRLLRGPAVYAWATLAALVSFRPPHLELESGGSAHFSGGVFLVAFANGSHYGGGMRIAPTADPSDGLLDVVIVRRVSKLRLLTVFPRVYRGSHIGHPAVELLRLDSARLRFDAPQPVNADGEGVGRAGSEAVEVAVEKRVLAVVRAAR